MFAKNLNGHDDRIYFLASLLVLAEESQMAALKREQAPVTPSQASQEKIENLQRSIEDQQQSIDLLNEAKEENERRLTELNAKREAIQKHRKCFDVMQPGKDENISEYGLRAAANIPDFMNNSLLVLGLIETIPEEGRPISMEERKDFIKTIAEYNKGRAEIFDGFLEDGVLTRQDMIGFYSKLFTADKAIATDPEFLRETKKEFQEKLGVMVDGDTLTSLAMAERELRTITLEQAKLLAEQKPEIISPECKDLPPEPSWQRFKLK